MGERLTAPEIVALLRRRGIAVTERHVIAARRNGFLASEKDGRCVVSGRLEVDEWAADGCQVGAGFEPITRQAPRSRAAEMTDEESFAVRFGALSEEEQAHCVARMRSQLAVARSEIGALRSKMAELQLAVVRTESNAMQAEDEAAASVRKLRSQITELELTINLAIRLEAKRVEES
jgi:hypothetical protein